MNVSYDDSKRLGAFALHPHIIVLYNFDGVVGISKSDAWYFEAGITPGIVFAKNSSYPVTLTAPVILGLGDARFYPTDAFGYLSLGANVSMPIVIGKSFGSWSANVGITYQVFGNATASVNLERHSYVAQAGIKWEF